jgi:dGTPase
LARPGARDDSIGRHGVSGTHELYRHSDSERLLDITDGKPVADYCSAFRRDYGRLLHSPAFRRLQGKTQLFPGLESDFFRNRLTHSLEVAQIAKGIATKLNRDHGLDLNLDLVEFAGLAHDLGHPPFGHTGEAILNRLMATHGGFEGNAQTLRILTRLEKKLDNPQKQFTSDGSSPLWFKDGSEQSFGLNLAARSIASILKYDTEISPRKRQKRIQKGYYASEKPVVDAVRMKVAPGLRGKLKTVECQIMDIADDIAYSTYDIDDALKAGFVTPLDMIYPRVDVLEGVTVRAHNGLGDPNFTTGQTLNAIRRALNEFSGDITTSETLALAKAYASNGFYRNSLTSKLINRFINGVVFQAADMPSVSNVTLERSTHEEVEVLKHLTFEIMVKSSRLQIVSRRAEYIISTMMDMLKDKDGWELLPDDFQTMYRQAADDDALDDAQSNNNCMRVLCDFIAGMTDRYAVEFYCKLRSETYQAIYRTV